MSTLRPFAKLVLSNAFCQLKLVLSNEWHMKRCLVVSTPMHSSVKLYFHFTSKKQMQPSVWWMALNGTDIVESCRADLTSWWTQHAPSHSNQSPCKHHYFLKSLKLSILIHLQLNAEYFQANGMFPFSIAPACPDSREVAAHQACSSHFVQIFFKACDWYTFLFQRRAMAVLHDFSLHSFWSRPKITLFHRARSR